MDMCPKDLVCDRNTWYVPERPGMFSKILACVRKRCDVHTIDDRQFAIDYYASSVFADNFYG